MKRGGEERLEDILRAVAAVRAHLDRGSLHDGLVYDGVRMRLVEIGEAARALTPELRARAPEVPWREVFGMRDVLAHRYFDTQFAVVSSTVRHDLEPLVAAVRRLRRVLEPPSGPEVQV